MYTEKINPFDILSGKVVILPGVGTYWFKDAGVNITQAGNILWYNLHREDGPAIRYANGDMHWFVDGKQHREGGPASVKFTGITYYKNGMIHREDGPAIEWHNGGKEWWLNDRQYTELQHSAKVRGY